MKQILSIIILSLAVCLVPGCVEDPEMPDDIRNALEPEVTTGDPSAETATSVKITGEVKKENGAPTIVRGFAWGTKDPVTFENMVDSLHVPTHDNHFSAIVAGLTNNKQYYIAAFAGNVAGKTIGLTKGFMTKEGLGKIETLDAENIKAESALVGGNILDQGEGQIKLRGVYFWKAGTTQKDSILSTMQTNSYTCQLTGLAPGTTYYMLAFATSQFGTIEGSSQKEFTTPSGRATINSFEELARDYTYADFKAVISEEGDAPVTARGFCYTLTLDPPVVTHDTILCESGAGEFSGRIKNLQANKKYYVRAYAVNAYGVEYSGNTLEVITLNDNPTVVTTTAALGSTSGTIQITGDVQDPGRSAITAAGICWSTSSLNPPTISDSYQVCTTALGVFNGTIPGVKGGQTYYIRAYASNSTNTAYGDVKTVTTPDIFKQAATYTGESRIPGSAGYFTIGNSAYLVGGDTGPTYTNTTWVYEPLAGWTQLSAYPENVAWMTAVNYNQAAFSLGGKIGSNLTNRFYIYSATNYGWSEVTPAGTPPTAVARASGCALNLSVFYIGGIRKPGSGEVASAEVWRYVPVSNAWYACPNIPEAQYGGFSFVVNEVMYTGFGYTSTGASAARTKKLLRSVDSNATSWEEETIMPGSSPVSAAVVHQNQLYVVDESGYIWSYNFSTKVWTRKSQLASANRVVHCMYSIGNYIYIGLGTNKSLISYDPTWDN